jgi:hypothetical protein
MASVLDAVAAVMVKLMYETVVTGKAPLGRTKTGNEQQELLNTDKRGAAAALAQVLTKGVGEGAIWRFVGAQIGWAAIISATATLKASTIYATLMQGVVARVKAEYEEDSESYKRALQLEAAAGRTLSYWASQYMA